ncbi:hypothetical protein [uncultured Methylibium sp.]|uniref:hypothetical protein n=1 Tax=uncultured Methylibium sp. TaxID=381093 RepID=UPI0025F80E3A|nr:hypothetical protein [uncultured Methylibium sp.]
MRLVFGVLSLLLVVAIVATVARRQLSSVAPSVAPSAAAQAGVPAAGATPAQQSQQLQRKVADDVNKLMQQAPARSDAPAQ